MATKKIMLWPSARSKFVKDGNMKILMQALWVLTIFMVLQYYYLFAFMYAVKLLLMVVLSIIVTRETEILFYTHDKDIDRQTAKDLIKKSYPEVTAMIYALLIPVGTPLWLVGLGAALATLLGKLLFGGFHHMVFHSSLVGVIVVTLGWSQIVDGVAFMTSFDNYILELLFDNSFFNNTLAIGGNYDPATAANALAALTDETVPFYAIGELFVGLNPGVVGSALVLLLMFVYFVVKKVIDWKIPVIATATFVLTAWIVGLVQQQELVYPLYHLFSGSFLFVAIFVMTDPITTPMPFKGKIVFGVVVGALTVFIRLAGTHEEGVIFAVLFMSMLTPLLNEVFKEKRKAPVKKAGAKA
ncbi:RnfABCDGE type electron transport complex subunit D [Candidatus Xianfuyuplasma coldseepsis]|uniref:RnfABCDGE type electron transport complex subunit D n=1 Tax=Candidatus Xianfuyuplasma coldseepsis TaxID=2782163 RepID=A0A7L7KPV8_9MOLU|nr:RnfABCDGE type electron transport complex subunit D [Xianfuyuplasma coldseepsis]QMS84292.1 RnfABCDGE type electron transport complex subunit D [Xianfuyuplasma coldseepsis]